MSEKEIINKVMDLLRKGKIRPDTPNSIAWQRVFEPKEPKVDVGDIVVYYGGLFRVNAIEYCGGDNYLVTIGSMLTTETNVHKASAQEINELMKGGES